jgi:predicted HicB family RNase H-like nuclease
MVMSYTIENGNVVYTDEKAAYLYGMVEKNETVRKDDQTVEDIIYMFDLELGQYVEQSRTEREEPLPPISQTPEQRITQLEEENVALRISLTQIYEEKELEKASMQEESINNMLAITELYEMIIGGN